MEEQEYHIPPLFSVGPAQIGLGLLLFLALVHRRHDLSLLSLLVIILMAATRLWAKASIRRIACEYRIDKEKLFPGEKLTLNVVTANNKLLPIRHRVEIPVAAALHPKENKTRLIREDTLWWHQQSRFQWDLFGRSRGVHPIGPPHILTGDLFAFFFKEKTMGQSGEVIVFPRLVPLQPLILPRRDFFGAPGAASPVQDPVYILGTRDYQHGQPAKRIHWKASARHSRLQEKVFESTVREKALILIEVSAFAAQAAAAEFERTLEVAGSLARQLLKRGSSVGLAANAVLTGRETGLTPVAGTSQQLSLILEALARMRLEPKGELIDGVLRQADLPWGLSSVYFCLEADQRLTAMRQYLLQRRIPMLAFACRTEKQPAGRSTQNLDRLYFDGLSSRKPVF